MKTLVRSLAVVAVITTFVLAIRPAHSENAAGAFGPSVAGSGTTVSLTLWSSALILPLATTGALVYFLVIKKDPKALDPNAPSTPDAGGGYVMSEEEAEKWAELYLRDQSEQLTTDIARGYGPALADLSQALQIKPEHRVQFGAQLQANAAKLLPYTNKSSLTKKRAGQFFTEMGDILRTDALIAKDLAELAAKI